MKTAERIGKEGKLQTGAFWEFKKKMDKSSSQEMPSAMLNKKKEEKTTKQEIKSIFEEFYTELFEPTQPTTVMEELCQNITQQVFDHIMEKANNDKTPKTVRNYFLNKQISIKVAYLRKLVSYLRNLVTFV